MRLKSYFAKDVRAALHMAREELGPEALLVHSKRTPVEARHLGEWEVVFATGPAPESGAEAAAALAPGGNESYGRLSAEVTELRRQMERMAAALARSAALASARAVSEELAGAFAGLIESEVDAELAHEIVSGIRNGHAGEDKTRPLARALAERFTVDAQLGKGSGRARTVALVGPCGSGKTTTLVKLAVRYGLSARRPTQLLSMDTYRIAAFEQLRSYAAILGVGFQALETPGALEQALEEHRNKDLILIDTPGHGVRDLDAGGDLARFLAGRPDIDTHLVLTSSMKPADLSRAIDRFEIFRPGKLLFTRLDETESFGGILNEAARTGKPVSFLAAGQQIPEDLEPATKERILELILKRAGVRAAAAAA